MKVNSTKDRRVCVDKISPDLGKIEAKAMPSSLGCRSIVAVGQADDILAVDSFLKFTNFNSKAYFGSTPSQEALIPSNSFLKKVNQVSKTVKCQRNGLYI